MWGCVTAHRQLPGVPGERCRCRLGPFVRRVPRPGSDGLDQRPDASWMATPDRGGGGGFSRGRKLSVAEAELRRIELQCKRDLGRFVDTHSSAPSPAAAASIPRGRWPGASRAGQRQSMAQGSLSMGGCCSWSTCAALLTPSKAPWSRPLSDARCRRGWDPRDPRGARSTGATHLRLSSSSASLPRRS